ncbi:response regulator transcription factor [Arthrobacter sp. Sr24]
MGDSNGKTALAIEDDEDIRGLLEILLRQMGFHVMSAATGCAGVELVRKFPPDLITLDMGLPDSDGLSILKELRTFHRGKIVMLSARGQQHDIDQALACGVDAYLLKPFTPKNLKAELVAVLER